jgi:hypothetical protein
MSKNTTHFRRGLTNVADNVTGGYLILPDPTTMHMFWDDFDKYTAGDWVINTTEEGGGDATEALADADGGILVVTNDAADNDADFFQWAGGAGSVKETFTFAVGKKLTFKARFKVSDATQSDFIIGLYATDTTPLSNNNGVYFQKDDGDALLDLHMGNGTNTTDTTSLATVGDNTYLTVGFVYTGGALGTGTLLEIFVNDALVGSSVTTNLPTTELAVSFGIQNGEAVAKIMSLDYIFVAKER